VLLLARALHSRTERGTTHVEVFRGTGSPGDCGPRAVVQKVHASSHRVAALVQEEARHLKHNNIGMKQR
jgi:hypothetical protein